MSSLGVSDVDFGEHGVIYITSDRAERPIVSEWTPQATKEFIRVFPKYLEAFTKGKLPSKRRIFENVAGDLKKLGYKYTYAQCENKWKTMKRKYFHRFEKARRGEPVKGMKYQELYEEEVAYCLSLERPAFKKALDSSKRSSRSSLSFSKKIDTSEEEVEEDYEMNDTQEYSQDDAKLLELVLNGDEEDDDAQDNKQNVLKNIAALNKANNIEVDDTVDSSEKLCRELSSIKSVLKRNLDTTNDILKTQISTHDQLVTALDASEKREEEKLDLKRRKLEVQTDLVQQVKIQNSLIAKLIQKLGNNSSSK